MARKRLFLNVIVKNIVRIFLAYRQLHIVMKTDKRVP